MLLWLSARGEGSWQVFRAAMEKLHVAEDFELDAGVEFEDQNFPLHQQLRLNLERLGHVEFFARECEEGWRVAPPALAATCGPNGWIGVLCGARSDSLLGRFIEMIDHLQVEIIPQADAPDVYRVLTSEREELAKAGERSGLHFQSDAPLAILSHLPQIDQSSQGAPTAEFPLGADWVIHEFLPDKLGWRKVTRSAANSARMGFFRFIIHFQRPRYFLRRSERTYELPRAIGIYALMRRQRYSFLRYDGHERLFTVPAICRPPRLLERALVLCSGLPPTFEARESRLIYHEIQPDIARLAAQLLQQPLL